MAKISIILPIYNSEKYISKCLESLVDQTFDNIEILCINDGSCDNSLEIIKEYSAKDKRIKIFNQKNAGPATARNVGLQNASSPYIMFCDSDDRYKPNMCAEMYNAIEKNKVDLVMCDLTIILEDKNHYRSKKEIEWNYLRTFGKIILNSASKSKINALLWNKIYKTDLIRKYAISFPNGYECDDDAFIIQYLSVGKTAYGINKKLYDYLMRSNSIMGKIFSKKNNARVYDAIYAFEFAIRFIKKNNKLHENLWVLDKIYGKIFWAYRILGDKGIRKFLSLLSEKVLSYFSYNELHSFEILTFIKEKNYKKAIIFLPFEIKIFDKTVFKKVKKGTKTKYYLFKIKIWTSQDKKTKLSNS
ncbi:MAG: glycosyltransferase [Lactobacillales bacterium]|jgi:glycosyltransferase involved in cell wall biosynthesis|nr:glycosyltransferase [Lactobacillales bacterium]